MSPPVAELLVVQIKRDQGSRETRRTIHSEIPTPVIRIAIKLTSQILSATSALYAIMHTRTGGRGFDDGGRKLLRDSPLRRDSSTVRLWPQAVESHDGDVFLAARAGSRGIAAAQRVVVYTPISRGRTAETESPPPHASR